jgi:stress response protein SCP2
MDKDGNSVCNVSYQQLEASAVWHSGDITSAPHGAEEIITVDLDKLPENAFMLTFTVNSYSGQNFDDISEAAMSLRDDGLEGNSVEGTREICAFRMTGTHKAVVACSIIRKEKGWAFRCLNTPQAQGATIQTLLGKIKKEFDAMMADAATQTKRLVDAALLLALCLRERMGDDKCEIVLFSSSLNDGPGYIALRNLGPKVLANIRRCHVAAKQLGRGTTLPISYLQELAASQVKLDHLVLLTDGLISPAKSPADVLSRWLRSYRASVHPVKYTCIDVLGLGKPSVGDGSNSNDVLISGYSEAVLRYLTQEPGAQLAEVEAIELPPPKEFVPKEDKFDPPART